MNEYMSRKAGSASGGKNKSLMVFGVILGIVFFAIGLIYATHTAGQLPGFFPGFAAGAANVHVKHSIASFIVGVACFIVAWFASGPKKIT